MLRFLVRRVLSAVPTTLIVVTLAFFLIRFAPGGPFTLERALAPQIMENMMRAYHLDDPLWRQYLDYIWNAMHGDFGPSFIYRDFTVAELIAQGLPYSVKLGAIALTLALLLGVSIGTLAALRQNSPLDHLVMAGATIGLTVPNFVVGPTLSLIFAVGLSWASSGGWGQGTIRDLALPIVTLALPQLAIFARLTRGSMIEALRTDHVRTARAYGLGWRTVVVVHALRGALLPVVSYFGPAAAGVLTGSIVVETVFAIPGVGRYFVLAAINRDYTLVMATVLLIGIFIIAFNLIVDLLYGVLDPRVRYD
ncbi:MAG: oligopeptide ABC transporter permease OppB [Bauldia sp.]